jgi:hypothetical protein
LARDAEPFTDPAKSVWFDPAGQTQQTAYGRRFSVVIATSRPGEWRLTVDENPAVTVKVRHLDTEETMAATSILVDAEPGTYHVTIAGIRGGATTPDPPVHGTLTVLPEPPGPVVATVAVTSDPSLTLSLSEAVVPAGVIEFLYGSEGGTHALVIDGFPGFELQAPSGPTTRRLELPPGTYELSCPIPGHADAGERATLTVVEP